MALYGSIVFWYGAWTQLDVGFSQDGYRWASDLDGVNSTNDNPWCTNSDLPYVPKRDAAYVAVGTLLLVATDSLYSNAGVGGACWVAPRLSERCESATCFGLCNRTPILRYNPHTHTQTQPALL